MAHWLVKTEPSTYSWDDLVKEGGTAWTGVKNAAAQLHMRAMKAGDEVLFYHTGDEKAVVALAKVARAAYPDPTNPGGKAVAVDLGPVRKLKQPVTLAQIKADKRFKDWGLVKIGRLSVVPTTSEQWKALLAVAAG
ncbi:MAG TPA: EVE domain-containing protein [Phycisphaerae bacterium]|nr:EVE domain-containing protein [Phycisphaerae bacterium]